MFDYWHRRLLGLCVEAAGPTNADMTKRLWGK
jgi:hypothetical protein